MLCATCLGTGRSRFRISDLCPVCRGRGTLPDDPSLTEKCRPCLGTGLSIDGQTVCSLCGGVGLIAPAVPNGGSGEGPLVFFIEAGKPRTAHLTLVEVFSGLSGPLAICDPYYGLGSLVRLDALKHCTPIRFLTKNADRTDISTFPRAVSEWKREHGDLEARLSSSKDLHDRFIHSPSELVILGHGLKDIGNKESFVIRIPRTIAPDMMDEVLKSFDCKWSVAAPI